MVAIYNVNWSDHEPLLFRRKHFNKPTTIFRNVLERQARGVLGFS